MLEYLLMLLYATHPAAFAARVHLAFSFVSDPLQHSGKFTVTLNMTESLVIQYRPSSKQSKLHNRQVRTVLASWSPGPGSSGRRHTVPSTRQAPNTEASKA